MNRILLAQLNARGGRESEFNAWYDDIHAPDILAMRSATALQRFVRAGGERPALIQSKHKHLAMVETSDALALIEELNASYGANRMRSSDAVDPGDPSVFFFDVIRQHGNRPLGSHALQQLMLVEFPRDRCQTDGPTDGYGELFEALAARPGVLGASLLRSYRHWRFLDLEPAAPTMILLDVGNAEETYADWPAMNVAVGRRLAAAQARVTVYEALTDRVTAGSLAHFEAGHLECKRD